MGPWTENNKSNFYDGRFASSIPRGRNYQVSRGGVFEHIAERVEPWTYLKFPYSRKWDGKDLPTH